MRLSGCLNLVAQLAINTRKIRGSLEPKKDLEFISKYHTSTLNKYHQLLIFPGSTHP